MKHLRGNVCTFFLSLLGGNLIHIFFFLLKYIAIILVLLLIRVIS